MKHFAFAMAVILLLTGCVALNPPANDNMVLKQKPVAGSDYTFARWIEKRQLLAEEAGRAANEALPTTLVFLSFSGGGARAAAVASGVLGVLEEEKLSGNIALMSSTSGGSVAAAAYAANGAVGLAELDEQFLANDNMATLIPRMAARLLVPGANRTKDFAAYLDERLFPNGAPLYGDLIARWDDKAPFVVLNATDMSSGRTFEFTQEAFSELCSNLATFPVTQAVAASAAFPLLLHPLPLRNHWSHVDCAAFRSGKSAAKELQDAQKYPEPFKSPARVERALYAYSLEHSYPGPSKTGIEPDRKIEFIHLLDGGLADNLAARAVMRILGSHLNTLRKMGVSNLVLIQVNAKKSEPKKYDKSSALPSLLDIFWAVTLNPIDVATELSAYSSRLYTAELARTINLPQPEPNKISVFTMPVDFVLLDQNRRLRAQEIPTNWSLDGKEKEQDDLAFLKQVAKDLLKANPCFNLLSGKSKAPCEYANLVQAPEAPSGTVVASAPLPPPPAPSSPVPTASKVTYAMDAFFDFDKSLLKVEGMAMLDNLVSKIKDINLEVVIVVGHADNVGTDAYNRRLSMRRSEAVKAYLVSKGVERHRVYLEAKGETQPVADNNTEQGRAKNRRVEIEIVGVRVNR